MKLQDFPGREDALKKIIRYHSFPVMFYRSNLWQHSRRLAWMIEEITPVVQAVYPAFKKEEAVLIAQTHDDLEIVLGDIMLGEKLKYTPEQMNDLDTKERAAINEVIKMFPEMIEEYNYKKILLRYQNMDPNDVEAVVVKYFDKYDAFGEALHEVYAGNDVFTRPYKPGLLAPIESYTSILQTFPTKYPLFEKIRETKHPMFAFPEPIDIVQIAKTQSPYTSDSLVTQTEYTPYKIWKQNVLKYGGDEGKQWLLNKVE